MILKNFRFAKLISILLCVAFLCAPSIFAVLADENTQNGGDVVVTEGHIGTLTTTIKPDTDVLFTVYFDARSALAISATFEYPTELMTYNGFEGKVNGFSLSVTQRSGENGIGYLDVFGISADLVTSLKGIIPVIDFDFHINKEAKDQDVIYLKMINAAASDGQSDYALSDLSYEGKVSLEDTTKPAVEGISINSKPLEGFAADVTQYSFRVEYSVTSLTVEVLCQDGATATVKGADNLVVGENNVFIEVVTEDGSKYTYSVKVERLEDPNRVLSTDATLSGVVLSSGFVTPEIAKDVLDYVIYLPADASELTLEPIPTDERATANNMTVAVEEMGEKIVKVTVTAEDGSVCVYKFTMVVLPEYSGKVPNIGGEVGNISNIDFDDEKEEKGLYLMLPEEIEAFLKEKGIDGNKLLIIAAAAVLVLVVLVVLFLALLMGRKKKRKNKAVLYVDDTLEGAGLINKNGAVVSDDDIEGNVF